jgi:hypothetical protein
MIITQSYPLIRPSIYSPTAYPSSVQQHHIISNDQIALPRSILHHPALNAAFSLTLYIHYASIDSLCYLISLPYCLRHFISDIRL